MASKPRQPMKLTGWRSQAAQAMALVLVALAIGLLVWAAAAAVVLLAVPLIWAGEKVMDLWGWWAHVWGILGY